MTTTHNKENIMQTIRDFHVGQTVRVADSYWGNSNDAKILPRDTDLIVEAVHPTSPGSGYLTIQGHANAGQSNSPTAPAGSFGHLIFTPVKAAPTPTADETPVEVEKGTTPLLVGDSVTTAEQFNALPMGTVLTDSSDWIHTKIADHVVGDEGDRVYTTTWTTESGDDSCGFYACWLWDASITSFPETDVDSDDWIGELQEAAEASTRRIETLEGELSAFKQAASDERRRLCEEIDTLKATLLNADQRIAALIAEKSDAELRVEATDAALTYARSLLDPHAGASVNGFEIGYSKAAEHY